MPGSAPTDAASAPTDVGPSPDGFVCLLRGVNIGGVRIAMADLRALLQELGLQDVRTYVQSGNAVFRAPGGEAGQIAAAIRAGIAARFAYQVAVLVLPCDELCRLAGQHPLLQAGDDHKHLHVTFLLEQVEPAVFDRLALPAAKGEAARLVGRVVVLRLPHGYGRSKLTNSYFEKVLKVPATTRNWRTVLALRDLCRAPARR